MSTGWSPPIDCPARPTRDTTPRGTAAQHFEDRGLDGSGEGVFCPCFHQRPRQESNLRPRD